MSVRINGDIIHLEGSCRVEEAEALLIALQENPTPKIDMSKLEYVHMAVAQVLAAVQPEIAVTPDRGFIRELLLPALARRGEAKVIGDSAADF